MMVFSNLYLKYNFAVALLFFFLGCSYSFDRYDEKILIKPLSSGHVYTFFQFSIKRDLKDFNSFHFHLFPRSLGEILYKYGVQELHFSLSHGLWRHEKWGYPVRSAPPGAELWAYFKDSVSDVSLNWKQLSNILSGQFCASLNFIDDTNTAIPQYSFYPEGALPSNIPYNSTFLRYSSLPPEIVCTENLTPFRKLLPCANMAGLSTLLNALNLFNAPFVSLAVDVQSMCKDKDCFDIAVELILSVSVVFDPPIQQLWSQNWSFVKLFGSSLSSICPLASETKAYVDITTNSTGVPYSLTPAKYQMIEGGSDSEDPYVGEATTFAVFDLKELLKESSVNIAAAYKSTHNYGIIPPPFIHADRTVSGYGQENGGISCRFYNHHPKKPVKIVYFDIVPWFLRLYSHTLKIKVNEKIITPEYFYYQPAQDRKRPNHLELVLTLPPKSVSELNIDFDFAFLKWTEYPPDANHGFYVGSAVISTMLDTNRNFTSFPVEDVFREKKNGHFLRIHTQILLVSLPTPDFSMPYNVICLTCTVVALAFGPIHNITTKSLCPLDESENESFFAKVKSKVRKWWKTGTSEDEDKSKNESGSPECSEDKKNL